MVNNRNGGLYNSIAYADGLPDRSGKPCAARERRHGLQRIAGTGDDSSTTAGRPKKMSRIEFFYYL